MCVLCMEWWMLYQDLCNRSTFICFIPPGCLGFKSSPPPPTPFFFFLFILLYPPTLAYFLPFSPDCSELYCCPPSPPPPLPPPPHPTPFQPPAPPLHIPSVLSWKVHPQLCKIFFTFSFILSPPPTWVCIWTVCRIGRVIAANPHFFSLLSLFCQLRRQGVRLFLVWYQILQESASDECHRIFQQLVPGLGDGDLGELFSKSLSTPDSKCGQIRRWWHSWVVAALDLGLLRGYRFES